MDMQPGSLATIPGLPCELVVRVLEHLPRRDLHVVSRLSRRFYGLACSAGRAIHRTIYLTPDKDDQVAISKLQEVTAYALDNQHHQRPGVSLRLLCQCAEDLRLAVTPGFKLILDALTDSLPVLVSLEAYVPAFFCKPLYDALCKPAPRLRRLGLGQVRDGASPALLPAEDLFDGSAHRLHSLCLAFPKLPADWRPPSVFRRVTSAQLTLYRTSHFTRPSRILPQLDSLFLDLEYNSPQGQPLNIDLSGLHLEHLALADVVGPPSVIAGIDIDAIPVLECTTSRPFDASLWTVKGVPPTVPVCASITRLRQGHEALLSIIPTTGQPWTRTAGAGRGCESLGLIRSLATIPDANSRLVALMIAQQQLSSFLPCLGTLPAVRDLFISFTRDCWSFETLSWSRMHLDLPALRTVTLLCLGDIVQVRVEHVVALGNALKQDVRPAESRATLDMMRVAFVRPCTYKRVYAVFSDVHEYNTLDANAWRLADASSSYFQSAFSVPQWVYK